MLDKQKCSSSWCNHHFAWIFVAVLVISAASVCQSQSTHSHAVDAKSASKIDSLIRYLFTENAGSNAHGDHIEYNDLKSFVNTFVDELLKSTKYDQKCLKNKINQLDQLTNSKHEHHDDGDAHAHSNENDKFKDASAYLVKLANACLLSPKLSDSNSSHAHHEHEHDHHDHHHDHDHHENDHAHADKVEEPPKSASKHYKWLAAFIAATIISVVGVFCVAVVPLLNNFCFDYLFQFLVALAIGTLTGDAMLHLLPHAFTDHQEESHDNNTQHSNENIYKGLGTLTGIYVFFLIEKLMKMRNHRNERKKHKKNQKTTTKYTEVGAILDSKGNSSIIINADSGDEHEDNDSSVYDNYRPQKSVQESDQVGKHVIISNENHKKNVSKKSHNHAHGHGHMHSHQNKGIKTNAWMVIMGDGLHNFSDGLAIGASFASSITAGIGTTIAIFFHELPHEIGDFALLRKSGVSMKRAILFNILSSVLCFLGIFLGLLIGGLSFISNWSFLFIAGVFLYISLVDMLPELSENGEKCLDFFLQNFGFIVGVGIMLVIALYEHKLTKLLQL